MPRFKPTAHAWPAILVAAVLAGGAFAQEPQVESPPEIALTPTPAAAAPQPKLQRQVVPPPIVTEPPAAAVEVASPLAPAGPPAPVAAPPSLMQTLQASAPLAIVLFALVLSLVAILQFGLAGRLARDSRKSYAMTKQSADAATALAGIAAETAHRQLRAYVHQSLLFFQPLTDPDRPERRHSVQVETHWTNLGQTPAREVVTGGGWRAFDPASGAPDDFDFPDAPIAEAAAVASLGPSQMVQGIVTVPIGALEQAQRGEALLLVWSWVEYNDAFKGGTRRRTESAHRVIPSNNLHDDTARFFALRQTRFQGADEDCLQKPKTESRRGGQNA